MRPRRVPRNHMERRAVFADIGTVASMRPRRVPRNHVQGIEYDVMITKASMRPRRVPRNHNRSQSGHHSGNSCFNEAEARASESRRGCFGRWVLIFGFNEAEARASESHVFELQLLNVLNEASMRPRRVPRNHFPSWKPEVKND